MEEQTYKLTVEYDGTNYSGWQKQSSRRTVQGVMEEAAAKILHHPVKLVAAGRTDAGVHAVGQVASLATSSPMPPERLKRALNGVLPRDVTVAELVRVKNGFNARYDALSRTYRYTISERRLSVGRAYAWQVKFPLDRKLLGQSTVCMEGACNLRGFSRGSDDDDFSTVIHSSRWQFHDHLAIFEITAIRFFHHAVRSIVGSAAAVARGKESPDLLKRILETGNRKLAGPTAPACGLCLIHVEYGENEHGI
jgi:tRNA pseudouridine38-40 synthase